MLTIANCRQRRRRHGGQHKLQMPRRRPQTCPLFVLLCRECGVHVHSAVFALGTQPRVCVCVYVRGVGR